VNPNAAAVLDKSLFPTRFCRNGRACSRRLQTGALMLLRAFPSYVRTPLLLAGAAALAAPLAFVLAAPPAPPAPEPMAAAVAPLPAGERETRSYAYYPEQLAALSSLSNFAPVADPGRPAAPAAAPVREPQAARPPVRPAEAPRRAETRPAAPRIAPAAAAPAAAPAPKDEWSVFGLAVPKPGWPDGKALREKAAGWGEAAASLPDKALALGAGFARLWREPETDPARGQETARRD
jgi:hypothetical protein